MANQHNPIGGSTISRTLRCPAWLELSAKLPRPKAGAAADQGNLLHDAMELYFGEHKEFSEMVGVLEYNGIVLTEDHVTEFLTPAAELLLTIMEEFEIDHIMCEPFVEISEGYIGGSADVIGLSSDRKRMLVADYKFGRIPVGEKGLEQTRFYAACALNDKKTRVMLDKVESVVHAIIQPAVGPSALVREETLVPIHSLIAALEEMLSLDPAPIDMGEHCKYCPAAAICPEKKSLALSAKVIDAKTTEELSTALTLAMEVEEWAKKVKATAQELAEAGARINGFKLVEGRSVRVWNDKAEKVLTELLGDGAHDAKLIGITAAEKLLGKDVVAGLEITDKPEGKPTLVSQDDKRPEIRKTITDNLKNFVIDNGVTTH